MPAVTAFRSASFFVDEIAEAVEREHYPAEPLGRALPFFRALIEGIKFRSTGAADLYLRVAVHAASQASESSHPVSGQRVSSRIANISSLPPCDSARRTKRSRCAKPMRLIFSSQAWLLLHFVSIPILNLATPIFAMAFMVHVHKEAVRRADRARSRHRARLSAFRSQIDNRVWPCRADRSTGARLDRAHRCGHRRSAP